MRFASSDLIDLTRYPIAIPEPARYAVLAQLRGGLHAQGCAVLKGFLTPAGIAAAVAKAESVAYKGHRSYSRTNTFHQG